MVDQCPLCGSTHLILDPIRGEIYCQDCGLVVEEDLDRVQMENNPYDLVKGVNYFIGSHYTNNYEIQAINPSGLKLPKEWTYVKDYVNTVASKLYIPKPIQDRALKVFLEAYKKGILNKRTVTLEGVSLTSLFIVARGFGYYRVTPTKLIEYGRITPEEFLNSALWVAFSTSDYFSKESDVCFEEGDLNESEHFVNNKGDV